MLYLNPDNFILKPALATIHCEPNWKWRKRDAPMPNYDLFYVWNGEGTLWLNKKPYKIGKGHCFLFKPGDWTEATHNPQNPLVLTYIHFDVESNVKLIPSSHRIIKNRIAFESLLSQYVRLFLVETFGAEIEGKLILKQIMIHLLREEYEQQEEKVQDEPEDVSNNLLETILEIANYIQQHPGKTHTIESLAARANLSPRYFSKKFKQIVGHTVKSYIVYSRIKRAEHLLHNCGMTVTETAYALGYNDLHFFSRQFKQYTGKNPSEIR
ncbi:AraC family transcriptional regulator [Pallidibacillus thermolactis]|jgi:AraC family transcriptional regulator, arabinose operon regulatory protein|uniref:AraC family transcriptional regulator n=1 Tax=Pallidibacillus thermolactis TaxID=251051 RepID=UPI00156A90AE|nr:AraC family transcriptional regulator [Pallidibacillus thermolactis]MCU9601486.1 AraC family transcriptional regulator [Pallidibacillus thermolactis subsp. kokeshiiformis]MED1673560.1 AraC family transcriptional regulator [Pallidibacillus thermolactis subsp. kokeshiiformis]